MWSISEIGLMIQDYFRVQMSWSMAYKLTQAVCQTYIISTSKTEENETFELICLERNVLIFFHMILTSRIHWWNKLMIQYNLQGQMKWSRSFDIAQAILRVSHISSCWICKKLGANYLGFILNNVVWINFWDCFHDPIPALMSQVMAILVTHLQFHFPSPPLLF